jgi:hypothetical protein
VIADAIGPLRSVFGVSPTRLVRGDVFQCGCVERQGCRVLDSAISKNSAPTIDWINTVSNKSAHFERTISRYRKRERGVSPETHIAGPPIQCVTEHPAPTSSGRDTKIQTATVAVVAGIQTAADLRSS